MQKQGKISNDERTDKACETEVNSRIDFGTSVFVYVCKCKQENR